MNDLSQIKTLFRQASQSFLSSNGMLAAGVRDTKPERAPRQKPLDPDQAQKKGQARTLVCLTRYSTGRLDQDNLYGGVKPLVDALRYAGIIGNDDPDSILLIVRQRKCARKDIGTEVIVISGDAGSPAPDGSS